VTHPFDSNPARRRPRGRGGPPSKTRHAGELIAGALRSLGVPSARLTRRIHAAWEASCEEGWRDRTSLHRLEGGVLEIAVGSSALRDELVNFHRDRLLAVLRTALPDVPLVGIRFLSAGSPRGGTGDVR
jgi:hypothetical protein